MASASESNGCAERKCPIKYGNSSLLRYRSTALVMVLAVSVLVLACGTSLAHANKQKDGKIAQKLEEYHSTIKCVVNIAEETLPELNDFITCCGFWALHDFLIHKVDDECDAYNLQQVKHLTGLVVPNVRDHCIGYEHGSFTCRMLVIMPITFAVLFITLIVAINVCACVSFYKWIAVRRKYRRVTNLNTANDLTITKLNAKQKYTNDP